MKALLTLLFGTVFSKIIGVLREIVFAALFGTSGVASAYRISQAAFTAPTHALVLETVSGGLVPLYKRTLSEDDDRRQALVIVALCCGLAVSALIAVVLIAFPDWVVHLIAPSADPASLALAARMTQLMGIATPFYVLSNLVTFIETAHGHYGALSFRPTLLNVAALAAALLAFYLKAPVLLVTGVAVSHVLFFGWTVFVAARQKDIVFRLPRDASLYRIALREFLRNSAPLLTLPVITQGNFIVERIVASHLGTPVIAALDYARFITDTFLTLSAVPLGLITLSKHGGARDEESTRNLLQTSMFLTALSFPIGLHLSFVARDLVALVFSRGAFGASSVEVTAAVLGGLGVGLGATIVSYFILRAMNAQLRNVQAVAIVFVATAVNMAVDLTLWRALGPLVLGLGASCYGLVCFVLAASGAKLWRRVGPLLLWILVFAAADAALVRATSPLANIWLRTALSSAGFLAVWAVAYVVSPSIRLAMDPITERVSAALERRRA